MTKSTVTTERLKEVIAGDIFYTDEQRSIAAELLAAREARPVEVTDEMAIAFHRALNDGGIGEADLEEIKIGLRGALCNYTAPPAPALPGELLDAMAEVIRISDRDHEAWARAKSAISVCRAAIQLSGNSEQVEPVSGGYTLPEGYKLVPVELTPEMQTAWDNAPCNHEDDTVNMMNAYRAMIAAAPTPTK